MVRIDGDVIRLTSEVQDNDTDIASNLQNTVRNAAEITRLTGEVNNNDIDIASNRRNTASNAAGLTRLTSDVQRNDSDININRRDITTHSGRLTRNSRRLSVLENTPPPPPINPTPVCSPLLSSVQSTQRGLGYPYSTSCNTSCDASTVLLNCREAEDGTYSCSSPNSANPISYETRDGDTLNCLTRTINFHAAQRCVGNYTGNPCL